MKRPLYAAMAAILLTGCASVKPPKPYGPLPSKAQVEWQRMETNMFCHFGPNTFTGEEWGSGKEKESVFNPTDLDCDQWARTAKQFGFGGIVITAKHHDGFCLWPSTTSDHSVAKSTWRNGKGDVLKELSQACRKEGLKFGVYISPWDRNAESYGTPAYNEVFRKTIEDVHSHYGDIYEQWFDGANGEGPNGRHQVYDWPLFNGEVLRLHPNAVIFSDVGPGCRWVGNEEGKAPEECWSRMDTTGKAPGHAGSTDSLGKGCYNGSLWIPAEVDVSIRKGWFYRDSEEPKSVDELVDIYLNSVGHNALLLLNVPPDRRGHICEKDSVRLMELRERLDEMFANPLAKNAKVTVDGCRGRKYDAKRLTDDNYDTYWATKDDDHDGTIDLEWNAPVSANYLVLQEYIPLGQRVEHFRVEALVGGQWKQVAEGTTIGYKKIVRLGGVKTSHLRVVVDKSRACVAMNEIGVY